ncbi:MAG: hypothetical protein U0704_06410 [Candidatus Eisenbacteria bacterium]
MDWSEIRSPGAYLHLASGLLARVYDGDVEERPRGGGGRFVKLSDNPGLPLEKLRAIAAQHGLEVNA